MGNDLVSKRAVMRRGGSDGGGGLFSVRRLHGRELEDVGGGWVVWIGKGVSVARVLTVSGWFGGRGGLGLAHWVEDLRRWRKCRGGRCVVEAMR